MVKQMISIGVLSTSSSKPDGTPYAKIQHLADEILHRWILSGD